MKCNDARIGDVASFRKVSIKPDAGTIYHCYSLPAFDNARKPEVLDGSEILSNKLHIENGDILSISLICALSVSGPSIVFKPIPFVRQSLYPFAATKKSIATTCYTPL